MSTLNPKLRIANHDLDIEKGRHINTPKENRFCILCRHFYRISVIECEFHFLLVCPIYQDIRNTVADKCTLNDKTLFNFTNVMKSKDIDAVSALSYYVYHAFKRRTELLHTLI